MSNPVAAVARPIVSLGFGVARVPVDLLASVTGNGGNREWGPTLAFDSVEATVRQVLGSVLGDPDLAAQGQVKDARVQQHGEAAEREQAADARREVADERFRERRQRDQQEREDVRRREQQRKEELEQERQQREQQARQREQERKEQAERDKAKADERIDQHEHEAKKTRVAAESEAVAAEREAAERKAEAQELAEAADVARKRR
jgi:membrane protein involved in colicin uptake